MAILRGANLLICTLFVLSGFSFLQAGAEQWQSQNYYPIRNTNYESGAEQCSQNNFPTRNMKYDSGPSRSSPAHKGCYVTAPWGNFLGVKNESILRPDVQWCSYLGIQYATAPRFQRPTIASPMRSGVYNAISDGNKCPQISWPEKVYLGSEDCLYLNVYVPEVPRRSKSLKSVMVYCHGGAFFEGSSSSQTYSPDYLIPHDVIVVAMNYRTNVYGFLNLDADDCPGNMGMWDQVTALRWVQLNIKSFGGDPNSVTLFGESTGAIAVYLLAMSPWAQGLYHRAIIQSAETTPFINKDTQSYSRQFAKQVGYTGDTSRTSDVLRYLRTLNRTRLLTGFNYFMDAEETSLGFSQPFTPSSDISRGSKSLLPGTIDELGPKVSGKTSFIIGQTSKDGTVFFHNNNIEELVASVKVNMSYYLEPTFVSTEQKKKQVISEVKRYYYSGNQSFVEQLSATLDLLMDLHYANFYEVCQHFKPSYLNSRIYNYQFCYDGTFQHYKTTNLGKYATSIKGVAHAEDINYMFYSPSFYSNLTLTKNDIKTIYEISTWWTNFAKTGNPNAKYDAIDVQWDPMTPHENNFLKIDAKSYLYRNTRIEEKRREFWDYIRRKYGH